MLKGQKSSDSNASVINRAEGFDDRLIHLLGIHAFTTLPLMFLVHFVRARHSQNENSRRRALFVTERTLC